MATRTSLAPASDNFDDDPFGHTSMTFGEHLEELRGSLFKAVLALAVGFLFGICVGKYVMDLIQSPLKSALDTYFIEQNFIRLKEQLKTRAEAGDEAAKRMLEELDKEKSVTASLIKNEGMLCEQTFILPEEFFGELKQRYPDQFGSIELPERSTGAGVTKKDLIPVYQWHSIVDDPRSRPTSLSVQETFMIWMKASFLTGAIVSSPFVFYFLWSFVATGLYPHEKKYVHVFLPFSVGLFLLGAMTAFLFVFPPVLKFFFSFNSWLGIDPDPRISEWLGFVLLMPLAFGVSFQLPLVMLFLERIGIFSVEAYLSKWRVAILVIAIASMVLSPGGDPYSMLLMMVPLVGLYFAGIALCRWRPSPRKAYSTD
jgi:sec-independent protein translocase protein TatC